MSQSMFDEDELFDEAAEETYQEVEAAVEQAQNEVPDADAVIKADADNLIGMLNAVNSTVSSADIVGELEEAKKQFAIGRRADAFDDDVVEEIEAEFAALEDAVEALQSIEDSATELTEAVTTFQNRDSDELGGDQNLSEEPDTDSDESSETDEEADSGQQQLE